MTERLHEAFLLTTVLSILTGGCTNRPPERTAEIPTDVRAAFLEGAGGARLFYRIVGSGPDTLFVIHGGPGAGMGSVLPDFAPLAETATLVFYDQRGGGRSARSLAGHPPTSTRLRSAG